MVGVRVAELVLGDRHAVGVSRFAFRWFRYPRWSFWWWYVSDPHLVNARPHSLQIKLAIVSGYY